MANKLFLSIEVPQAIKQLMTRTIEDVRHVAPDAEWTLAEKLHITLLFIGQDTGQTARIVETVDDALKFLGRPSVRLSGPGTFQQGVLFVGCAPSPNLLRLHTQLADALGCRRSYWKAHLTLGKGAGVNAGKGLIPEMPFVYSPTTINLYRTSRSGASYQTVHSFDIKRGSHE